MLLHASRAFSRLAELIALQCHLSLETPSNACEHYFSVFGHCKLFAFVWCTFYAAGLRYNNYLCMR